MRGRGGGWSALEWGEWACDQGCETRHVDEETCPGVLPGPWGGGVREGEHVEPLRCIRRRGKGGRGGGGKGRARHVDNGAKKVYEGDIHVAPDYYSLVFGVK